MKKVFFSIHECSGGITLGVGLHVLIRATNMGGDIDAHVMEGLLIFSIRTLNTERDLQP